MARNNTLLLFTWISFLNTAGAIAFSYSYFKSGESLLFAWLFLTLATFSFIVGIILVRKHKNMTI